MLTFNFWGVNGVSIFRGLSSLRNSINSRFDNLAGYSYGSYKYALIYPLPHLACLLHNDVFLFPKCRLKISRLGNS